MAKTSKLDLDRDYNINGVQYNKGKNVEVQSDHVQAIKDLSGANQDHIDFANTHHGAVPMHNDPQEATAQTPTRPLGGVHVRVEEKLVPSVEQSAPVVVEDPNEGQEAASEEAKDADRVSANEVK